MKAKNTGNVLSILPSWAKAESFVWQVWLLSIQGKSTRSALFYSWIAPAVVSRTGWQPLETEYAQSIVEDGRTIKIALHKATYYGVATDIQTVINKLLEGKYLSEALPESDNTYPPNALLNLNLGAVTETGENYAIRPEIFLAPEPFVLHWNFQAMPSPVHYGCWVKQIVNINKANHLLFSLTNGSTDARRLVKEVAMVFRQSTGFNLMESSAPRLGNIEWFHFPGSDRYLRPFVSFFARKAEGGVGRILTVNIKPDPASQQVKKLLIRCRLKNIWEVATDQVVERHWANEHLSIEFKCSEAITKVLVTIWEGQSESEFSYLLFEQECTLMRDLSISQKIVSDTIRTVRLKILDKLRRNEEGEKQKLMHYHRSVNTGDVRIRDYDNDPWSTAGLEIKSLMKELFPEKSKGRFFKNGWDESVKESGQLSFVKWLLETISINEKYEIILIDPFLDSAAIEVFAHARTMDTRYTMLTCTQHREGSGGADVETGQDAEPVAAETIRVHCKSHDVLLQGLSLEIFDLRSKEGGKRQLFHDRYILVVDPSGSVLQGYHLSNSIQGATRSAPLLITPIPSDTLPEVKEYVDSLLSTEMEASPARGETYAVRLFPQEHEGPKAAEDVWAPPTMQEGSEEPKVLKVIEGTQAVFALLFNDPTINGLSTKELLQRLQEKNMLSDDLIDLQLFSLTSEALKYFATALEASSQKDFERIWSLWANLLAHSKLWNESGLNLTNEWISVLQGRNALSGKLITLLSGYQREEALITDHARLYSMFQAELFESGLDNVRTRLLYFPSGFFGIGYPLAYASKFLVYSFPVDAFRVLERLDENLSACQWDESHPEVRARMQLTNQLAYYFFGYNKRKDSLLQELFLKSPITSFRAAGACALLFGDGDLHVPLEDSQFGQVLDLLKADLSDIEFRLSIAYLIRSNDTGHKIDVNALFLRLHSDWKGDLNLVKRVTTVLSGPLWANHSQTITQQFLVPLSKMGGISVTYSFDYWNDIFKLKITCATVAEKDPELDLIEQQRYDGFVSNTDIELTRCLIELAGSLEPKIQCKAIKDWIEMVKPALHTCTQPFVRYSRYHLFDKSCMQLFWVEFILHSLLRDGALTEQAGQLISSFLNQFNEELSLVRNYILDKGQLGVGALTGN